METFLIESHTNERSDKLTCLNPPYAPISDSYIRRMKLAEEKKRNGGDE